jgi:hypothetical protein
MLPLLPITMPSDGGMEEAQRRRRANVNQHWQGQSPYTPVSMRGVLLVFMSVVVLFQVAVVGYMLSQQRFHLYMFTYWNYCLVTLVWILVWCSLVWERWWLYFTALLAFPLTLGTTFVVNVTIVLVIQLNSRVFVAAGMGTGQDAQTALSLLHTGDWIFHDLPFIETLVLLAAGWTLYMRSVLAPELMALYNVNWRATYQAYFVFVPLLPLAIYSACFDISVQYPTGIPTWVLWICLVGVNALWQWFWFHVFTCSGNVELQLATLAPSLNQRGNKRESSSEQVDDKPPSFNTGTTTRNTIVRTPVEV